MRARNTSRTAIVSIVFIALMVACHRGAEEAQLEAQLASGDQLIEDGRVAEAIRSYERAAELAPEDPRPLRRKAIGLVLSRRDLGALQLFEKAAKLDPSPSAEALFFWATALQRVGKPSAAIQKYEAALAVNPAHIPAMNNLGILLQDSDPKRAIRLFEGAVRREPGDIKLTYNLGRAYEKAGRIEEAYNMIRRAVSSMETSDPRYADRLARLKKLRSQLPRGVPEANEPNILLVVVDTLRADHMSVYGYHRKTTPRIESFARGGVVFENAITQAPWTAPSIATVFTSLYPSVHGLNAGIDLKRSLSQTREGLPIAFQKALDPSQVTLAEALRRRGYDTVGFVSQVYLNSMFGFAQGFDVYQDAEYQTKKKRAEATNRSLFAWMDQHPKEPFFLFVHYNDPHFPYDPPPPFGKEYVAEYQGALTPEDTVQVHRLAKRHALRPEDIQYVVGLYDGEIAYLDSEVGKLLDRMASLQLQRPLITVITSDHGEEFLEHGGTSHGSTLYEEQLHVPLIFQAPKIFRPARIDTQVRLLDLMPTLLELAGVDPRPTSLQGASFAGLLRSGDSAAPRHAYSEATWDGKQRSVRTGTGLKLIEGASTGEAQLFDLKRDPEERTNLAAQDQETVKTLEQELTLWSEANRRAREMIRHHETELGEVVLDEKTQAQLKALGYME